VIRVFVADDHRLFREGLISLLNGMPEVCVVGQASDGLEVLASVPQANPQVVLMDLRMPRMGGHQATRALRRSLPQVQIVVLTVSEKDDDLFEAVKGGARGYLLKTASSAELLQTIQAVARGDACIAPAMAGRLLEEFSGGSGRRGRPRTPTHLTQREVEVLTLLAGGSSNREIAERLVITENTVRTHLTNILEKLHLKNRLQAVAYAVKEGLIPDEDDEDGGRGDPARR
jgi:DNA-binding NarL/FixJ family response regulator